MKIGIGITTLVLFTLTLTALATDQPGAPQAPADAAKARSTATPTKPRTTPARKKVSAAHRAQSRAMLNAAIEAQGMELTQAEASRQAAIQAEQERLQYQQAQQLNTIRQLSPRGAAVVRIRPDGSYETNTYVVFPNSYPLNTPSLP